MIDLLLKPVRLHSGGHLQFGDTIQIVCPGPSCAIAVKEYPFKRGHCRMGHLALSANVPPSSIDYAPYLSTDSIITASPHLYPVTRNSFVIENPNFPNQFGGTINYGDVFRIRAISTQKFNLYLFSAPAIRLHHAAIHSGNPKVRLSDIPSTDTLWSAWPADPTENLKVGLGIPVPTKKRLFLRHNGTGVNLSTEPNYPVHTYFGEELEVTMDNKRDHARRPYYPNFWYFDSTRGVHAHSEDPHGEDEFAQQSAHDAKINVYNVNKSAADEEKEREKERKAAEAPVEEEAEDEEPVNVRMEMTVTQRSCENGKENVQELHRCVL